MPELPEVETTLRGIKPKTEGQSIQSLVVRNSKLRWPVDSHLTDSLPGQKLTAINRRAKYLLLTLTSAKTGAISHLILHLGMSGNLRVLPHETPAQKHDHIDLLFDNGFMLRYHDPRRFGAFLWTDQPLNSHPLLAHLAPEPLSDAFNASYLGQLAQAKSCSIKSFIMNNRYAVGVGNIYANESLFLSGIHPTTAAKTLTKKQIEVLILNIKQVLTKAIEQGGTTLKDFLTPDGKPGYFEQELKVYGRENQPCTVCGTPIQRIVQQQRASYFCPKCQPEK